MPNTSVILNSNKPVKRVIEYIVNLWQKCTTQPVRLFRSMQTETESWNVQSSVPVSTLLPADSDAKTELVLFYAWQYSAAEVERYMRLASPPALVPSSDGATSSTKSAAISSTTPTPFLTTATASLTDAPKVTLIAPTATVIDVPSPAVPDNATTAAPLLPTHSTTRASKPRQAAPKKSIEQKDAPKARKRRVDVTAARTRTSKRSKKTATTDGSVPAAAAAVDGGGGTTVASDVPDQSPDRPKSAFGHLFNKPMPDATAFATTPSKSTRSTGNSLFSRAISADDDDQMMARTPPPPTSRRAALLSPVFAGGSVLLNDATQHGFFGGASTTARVTRSALFREDTRDAQLPLSLSLRRSQCNVLDDDADGCVAFGSYTRRIDFVRRFTRQIIQS